MKIAGKHESSKARWPLDAIKQIIDDEILAHPSSGAGFSSS
jgi:hypothetical protein